MTEANKSQYLKSGGTKVEMTTVTSTDLDNDTGPFVDLAVMVKDFDYQGGQAQEEETTVLASLAKEFELGLADAGTVALAGHFPIGHAAHTALVAANADKKPRVFRVTFPGGATFTCVGMVSQYTFKASASAATVSGTYNVRLTGEVKLLAGGGA
ncbi:hypothetical protein D3C81_318250 [compost metagenome]